MVWKFNPVYRAWNSHQRENILGKLHDLKRGTHCWLTEFTGLLNHCLVTSVWLIVLVLTLAVYLTLLTGQLLLVLIFSGFNFLTTLKWNSYWWRFRFQLQVEYLTFFLTVFLPQMITHVYIMKGAYSYILNFILNGGFERKWTSYY